MKTKRQNHLYFICLSAVIAALYVALTMLSATFGLSSGVIQLRFSEALCVLSCFTPAAIPGMTVGCFIANIITSGNPIDIIFGTLATLIGVLGGYALRRFKWLVSIPTVLANAIIVPFVLVWGFGVEDALPYLILTVGVGELLSATCLGMPLLLVLERYRFKFNG